MSAREEILARVRAQPDTAIAVVPQLPRAAAPLTLSGRTDLFCERVSDYCATVVRTSLDDVPAAVAAATRGMRLAIPPGLPRDYWPEGAAIDNGLSIADLDAVDGSVTTAGLAIAETGSIVLTGAAGEGRRALTLIPDTHVCLIEPTVIAETVSDAFDVLSAEAFSRRPITVISGPSATSDIEMQRVEGVHGPRNFVVIVCGEPSGAGWVSSSTPGQAALRR
jgi:L-lactate dehydrogenase complex protein LldG